MQMQRVPLSACVSILYASSYTLESWYSGANGSDHIYCFFLPYDLRVSIFKKKKKRKIRKKAINIISLLLAVENVMEGGLKGLHNLINVSYL